MILLLAVIAGLLAGVIRAWIGNRIFQPVQLSHTWLVIIAFLLQWLAFYLPNTQNAIPTWMAAAILITSLILLLLFIFFNINQPGFLVMGLGLTLNLIVIITNGGLMPISPDNAFRLAPHIPVEAWQPGSRFGHSKDIIITVRDTHFWWLSDRFLSPNWLHYRFVYSLGDVFVGIGTFWLLYQGCTRKSISPRR